MLCVSLAVICDYGVGSSWLNSRSSYPEGLIIFNPLHTGGQSWPIQPNIQSIIIIKMVSLIFLRIYSQIEAKQECYTRKKKVFGVLYTWRRESSHIPQAWVSSYSSPFLMFARDFPSQSTGQLEDVNHRRAWWLEMLRGECSTLAK